MPKELEELKGRLREIDDLNSAAAVLNWDQSTYMPPGGAEARGRQLGTLIQLAQEKFASDEVGKLLDTLQPYADSLPDDDDDRALIRITRREYERTHRVPTTFWAELAGHSAASYQAWTEARPANDFGRMEPYLEKTLELSRRLASYFPNAEHIADPLIEYADYGMTVATVRGVFGELREQLVPLVRAITAQPVIDNSCLLQHYPEAQQQKFGVEVVTRYGYDFNRGRQDKTHHPFATKFALGDVRITTRFKEDDLGDGLFSTMHESGHAMYEQGISPKYEATPLANGTSAGVHESQSRLWENLVGRSRGFWHHWYPRLQEEFPAQLGSTSLDTFYRAINRVVPSLIRTDADEVTYNLHVMLRFDLELDLLEGKLAVRDLPAAWNARYTSDLGITPPDDRDGVLQDVHWFAGTIGGAFQGYTLGNIMSAQFFDAAKRARPEIEDDLAKGEYGSLHDWFKDSIYQHGSKYTAEELIQRVTGQPLGIQSYIAYLRQKYGELYTL